MAAKAASSMRQHYSSMASNVVKRSSNAPRGKQRVSTRMACGRRQQTAAASRGASTSKKYEEAARHQRGGESISNGGISKQALTVAHLKNSGSGKRRENQYQAAPALLRGGINSIMAAI